MFWSCVKWLCIPIALLVLFAFFNPMEHWWASGSGTPPEFANTFSDEKVYRTVKNWASKGQNPGQNEDFGFSGLNIDLFLKKKQLRELQDQANLKKFRTRRNDCLIQFNNHPPMIGSYKIRGHNSIIEAYNTNNPLRLDYNIVLFNSLAFGPDLRLKKFYLMNMIYDPFYFEMAFSYRLLARLGLFPAYTQLVVLRINGVSQGLYLLVEPPKDAILRTNRNVLGIYRRVNSGYLSKYQGNQRIEKWHLNRLDEIIEEKKRGNGLVEELNKIMDLDAYFTWIAFNSLLRNADSMDEVFYYVVVDDRHPLGRIELMAWDYDDILKSRPDHGRLAFSNPLMFACEDKLDRLMPTHAALYGQYKRILHHLLENVLTPSEIIAAIDEIWREVDKIDMGLPAGTEANLKSKRKQIIQEAQENILARRMKLLQVLSAKKSWISRSWQPPVYPGFTR